MYGILETQIRNSSSLQNRYRPFESLFACVIFPFEDTWPKIFEVRFEIATRLAFAFPPKVARWAAVPGATWLVDFFLVAVFNGATTEAVVRLAARAPAVFTNACLVAAALAETFLGADAFGFAFFGVILTDFTVTEGTTAVGIVTEAALIFFFVACNCLRVD
jgi:hypothetical protein